MRTAVLAMYLTVTVFGVFVVSAHLFAESHFDLIWRCRGGLLLISASLLFASELLSRRRAKHGIAREISVVVFALAAVMSGLFFMQQSPQKVGSDVLVDLRFPDKYTELREQGGITNIFWGTAKELRSIEETAVEKHRYLQLCGCEQDVGILLLSTRIFFGPELLSGEYGSMLSIGHSVASDSSIRLLIPLEYVEGGQDQLVRTLGESGALESDFQTLLLTEGGLDWNLPSLRSLMISPSGRATALERFLGRQHDAQQVGNWIGPHQLTLTQSAQGLYISR